MFNKSIFCILIILNFVFIFFFWCCKDTSVEPKPPNNISKPVEDTTRVYINPNTGDTLVIYPDAVYARFYPWVDDTNDVKQIFGDYNLRQARPFFRLAGAWVVYLCVTDNRRAEYHFTPWGKEGFNNFGTDSLIEFAFAFFDDGRKLPTGVVSFEFIENTPFTTIDSLFNISGLRFLSLRSGLYKTVITPNAQKNVLDLGLDLASVPFATWVHVGIGQPAFPEGDPLVTCE